MEYNLDTIEGVRELVTRLFYSRNESEEYEKLLQKCIQKAQFFKDIDLEFKARLAYVSQVTWLHKKDKAIATFPWLLTELDKGGKDNSDHYYVLWMYKWIISNLPDFVDVPLERIYALYEDMEKRFLDAGAGIRVIHYFKMSLYSYTGQFDKVEEHLNAYLSDPFEGHLDDCRACQQNRLINLLLLSKKYDEAIEKFQPLLNKEMSCKEVPNVTYPKMAFVYWVLNEVKEASNMAALARTSLKMDRSYIEGSGYLLAFYAATKDFTQARALLEKQWFFCFQKRPERELFVFYSGFMLALKAFLKEGIDVIQLKSEQNIPLAESFYQNDQLNVPEALTWVEYQVDTLQRRFDRRNGNSFFAEQKAYWNTLLENSFA